MHLHYQRLTSSRSLFVPALLLMLHGSLPAQQSRIAAKIDNSERFALSGHIHPNARSEYDQGLADPSTELKRLTLVLQPSASQQAELDQLLADQQEPRSAMYHQWLTPEEYAGRFGVSQSDIDRITAWLQTQQLTVTGVARAGNAVLVSGTVAQVEGAFRTEIHTYIVNGESHYANATEPSLPAAMRGVVQAIRGLHNFRMKARSGQLSSLGLSADGISPDYTSSSTGNHYLGPDDFATIFDLQPLYGASINGSGQKIVVVGQSRINTGNLAAFRTYFGLSAVNLTATLVPNTRDPGAVQSDAQESDLDLEWASAAARSADLIFVYSYDVFDAVQYAVDQNLAPVLSMSYGECENSSTSADAADLQTWARQANAQGITWVAASGDSGAADCFQSSTGSFGPAATDLSLATDLPASVPEVTGVGGTTLNDGGGTYWNSSNNATTKASALSYIPETSWNDSTVGSLAASGGGASRFFSKPAWQTGTGVPADGARDVPDIAFPASPSHDGYMVYTTSGRQTGWYVFGGTSAGAPSFAGIVALLNHYLIANGYQSTSGLGNVNTHLYALATSTPAAFHDVTSGDNIVSANTCVGRSCTGTVTSVGYHAGVGYDQVTGLGSLDGYNFVTTWHSGALLAKVTPSVTLTISPGSISADEVATLMATVSSGSSASPSGTVTFSIGSTVLGTATLSGSSGASTAALTISGSYAGFATGSNTITAAYSGDSAFNSAEASATLVIGGSSSAAPSISAAVNAASYKQSYAPGMILAIFGKQLALTTQTAETVPLPTALNNVSVTINGVAAPLYYISPGQLNVQIPYDTPARTILLVVKNNGQTASTSLNMSAAAPGIFTDANGAIVPTASATRGQTIALYVTGAGAVLPPVSTGAVPASGATPAPVQTPVVMVGPLRAATKYVGIPSWSIGALQINTEVPANAFLGPQSVVVSIGGIASAAATLTVTE